MPEPIFLDYQATTPCDLSVVEAMAPFWEAKFGNPSSTEHGPGRAAREAVETARAQIANTIGAQANEILFTSGATEANNLALIGGMRHQALKGKKHLITAVTEHKCVLESARHLEQQGFDVTFLPVSPQGHIDLCQLRTSIRKDTGLISFMAANNEIGLLHPLKRIGEIAHEHGISLHTDAAQALGKIPLDVKDLGVSFMSLSAHKAYGPMGIGALYVRRRPRARLSPINYGGGQEQAIRSGTLATPLLVGFGQACTLIDQRLKGDHERALAFRTKLLQALPDLQVNGDLNERLAGNLNISFPHLAREDLLAGLSGFALSSGSACSDTDVAASYVLRALGLSEQEAKSSVRLFFGRQTNEEQVDALIKALKKLVPSPTMLAQKKVRHGPT